MKEPQERSDLLIRKLLICAVLVLAAGCATEGHVGHVGHDGVLSAKVVHQKGSARYSTGNNVWQPLKVGDTVKSGTIIQTAPNSRLDLVLGDGSVLGTRPVTTAQNTVRLWEDTLLSVDKLTVTETGADVATDTQLNLKAGHIYGVVKKMSAGSKYEVKIPNGVAGIRGTVYDIRAEGEVKVSSGSVVLASAGRDGAVVTRVIMGSPNSAPWTGLPTSSLDSWRNWPPTRRF